MKNQRLIGLLILAHIVLLAIGVKMYLDHTKALENKKLAVSAEGVNPHKVIRLFISDGKEEIESGMDFFVPKEYVLDGKINSGRYNISSNTNLPIWIYPQLTQYFHDKKDGTIETLVTSLAIRVPKGHNVNTHPTPSGWRVVVANNESGKETLGKISIEDSDLKHYLIHRENLDQRVVADYHEKFVKYALLKPMQFNIGEE